MFLKSKKILIIYQPWGWSDYVNCLVFPMIAELESIGAKVKLLDIKNPPFFKKNHLHKFKNYFYKKFYTEEDYYFNEEIKHYGKFYKRKLSSLDKELFDYTLIIRPDNFSEDFLTLVRSKSNKVVGYMWDGIKTKQSRYLLKTRFLFDKLFSFNKDDIEKFSELKLSFTTNFYYNHNINVFEKSTDIKYIGSIFINRKDLIAYNFCKRITDDFHITIFMDIGSLEKDDMIMSEKVTYIYSHIPYLETLNLINDSKAILDICRDDHKGLSFRFFESIQLEIKIITNNKDVVNYDFYNSENIMVIEDFNDFKIENVRDFLNKPYQKLETELVEYYNFNNWFLRNFEI